MARDIEVIDAELIDLVARVEALEEKVFPVDPVDPVITSIPLATLQATWTEFVGGTVNVPQFHEYFPNYFSGKPYTLTVSSDPQIITVNYLP